MPKLSSWIEAFRLRTLPLALSCIIMGSMLAIKFGTYNWLVILMSVVTTLLLQVLSNLANDYGDTVKGTDNENRLGPTRTVQSGAIPIPAMKSAIVVFTLLSLISGISLIVIGFDDQWLNGLLFLLIGIAAIAAAIKYTIGKTAYGYSGFGDLFVLLFFGFVGVLGTYYLNTQSLNWALLLPALSMGFFSTAVLNLNNMRDVKNDIQSGKHTLASRLGDRHAKTYHAALILVGIASALAYVVISFDSYWNLLFLVVSPLFIKDLFTIFSIKDESLLDPFLKKQALTTLLFSALFGVGLLL